jgi:hypothetical protein
MAPIFNPDFDPNRLFRAVASDIEDLDMHLQLLSDWLNGGGRLPKALEGRITAPEVAKLCEKARDALLKVPRLTE